MPWFFHFEGKYFIEIVFICILVLASRSSAKPENETLSCYACNYPLCDGDNGTVRVVTNPLFVKGRRMVCTLKFLQRSENGKIKTEIFSRRYEHGRGGGTCIGPNMFTCQCLYDLCNKELPPCGLTGENRLDCPPKKRGPRVDESTVDESKSNNSTLPDNETITCYRCENNLCSENVGSFNTSRIVKTIDTDLGLWGTPSQGVCEIEYKYDSSKEGGERFPVTRRYSGWILSRKREPYCTSSVDGQSETCTCFENLCNAKIPECPLRNIGCPD